MTKALIPKQGGNLANHTPKAGWPAPACRVVAAYGRDMAQQVAAGHGVNKFWSDVAPASALAAYAQNDWGRSIPERPRNSSCIGRRATMTIPAIYLSSSSLGVLESHSPIPRFSFVNSCNRP